MRATGKAPTVYLVGVTPTTPGLSSESTAWEKAKRSAGAGLSWVLGHPALLTAQFSGDTHTPAHVPPRVCFSTCRCPSVELHSTPVFQHYVMSAREATCSWVTPVLSVCSLTGRSYSASLVLVDFGQTYPTGRALCHAPGASWKPLISNIVSCHQPLHTTDGCDHTTTFTGPDMKVQRTTGPA